MQSVAQTRDGGEGYDAITWAVNSTKTIRDQQERGEAEDGETVKHLQRKNPGTCVKGHIVSCGRHATVIELT